VNKERHSTTRASEEARVMTYDERLERFEKRQNRIRVGIFCTLCSVAGFLFWRNANYVAPLPEPNYAGYYEGNWVNKSGDLVSGTGELIQRDYTLSLRKTAATPQTPPSRSAGFGQDVGTVLGRQLTP